MKRLAQILLEMPGQFWLMFVTHFPGRQGNALRFRYWRNRLKLLGNGATIDVGVYFQNPRFISIDEGSWIDRNVVILAGRPTQGRKTYVKSNPDFKLEVGEVSIGKHTHVAPNCVLSGIGGLYIGAYTGVASGTSIYSFSHHYRNLLDRDDVNQYSFTPRARSDQQAMILGPVSIGDHCAVGLNSVLLPGTSLKRGTLVASGSIISGTFPEQTLLVTGHDSEVRSLSGLVIKE